MRGSGFVKTGEGTRRTKAATPKTVAGAPNDGPDEFGPRANVFMFDWLSCAFCNLLPKGERQTSIRRRPPDGRF